jgi:hypothetical protein
MKGDREGRLGYVDSQKSLCHPFTSWPRNLSQLACLSIRSPFCKILFWPLSTGPGLDRHGGDGILWGTLDHSIAIGEINVGLPFLVEKSDNLEALKNGSPQIEVGK